MPTQKSSTHSDEQAFGGPGSPPVWSPGDKDGIGTAYSVASRVWFTIWKGIVSEVYFPTVDRPQTSRVQFYFSDGSSFAEDELEMETSIETIEDSLGYRVKGKSRKADFRYEKEIICDPHLACLVQHVKVEGDDDLLQRLKLYVYCAPHLDVAGAGNSAMVTEFLKRDVLVANRNDLWLALGARDLFSRTSAGYVGASDGKTDICQHHQMEWAFASAPNGNVALTGQIDLSKAREVTFGLAFGGSLHRALATLAQSIVTPYAEQRQNFIDQWRRTDADREALEDQAGDGGALYRASVRLLLAHEDKQFPGAMVASLAIPWGEAKGDEEGTGGYHLVWTRDMVQCAMGLCAAGKTETPLRALIYLAASQNDDGSFAQNFWVDGKLFWGGMQLDEVAFPVILAHRLWKIDPKREGFRANVMVSRAVGFLLKSGPITKQERWEEASGISPSTLAAVIAALICAADFLRTDGDENGAKFLEEYADWLEQHIEQWTVTYDGSLLPNVQKHFVRIAPSEPGAAPPEQGVGDRKLSLSSQKPGSQAEFAAKDIVDAGFLEFVRYGIRRADDPLVLDSLRVVDSLLKVESPSGTVWRRYNNDGYGQQEDGSAYTSFGKGRGWPLLTGERGHYEIAAGRKATDYIRWMEGLATHTHLIPEQSWDADESPNETLKFGRPTGSAVPLLWAHAEYVRLLRSSRDGEVYDLIPEVANRYARAQVKQPPITVWMFSCPTSRMRGGSKLRVLMEAMFELRYTLDGWSSNQHVKASETAFPLYFADVDVPNKGAKRFEFTFYWPDAGRWEERDFGVEVDEAE